MAPFEALGDKVGHELTVRDWVEMDLWGRGRITQFRANERGAYAVVKSPDFLAPSELADAGGRINDLLLVDSPTEGKEG